MTMPDTHSSNISCLLLTIWLLSHLHPCFWYWGIWWSPPFSLVSSLWSSMAPSIPTLPSGSSLAHATTIIGGLGYIQLGIACSWPLQASPMLPIIPATVNSIPAPIPSIFGFCTFVQHQFWCHLDEQGPSGGFHACLFLLPCTLPPPGHNPMYID